METIKKLLGYEASILNGKIGIKSWILEIEPMWIMGFSYLQETPIESTHCQWICEIIKTI